MTEFQDTRDIKTNSFTSFMNKDVDPVFLKDGQITHAINSQFNSLSGDLLFHQNEEGNLFCVTVPYIHIGTIPLKDNKFLLFSTDNVNSEIGILNKTNCEYVTLVNNKCLNFKTTNLIRGAASENSDCEEIAYWCDDLNNNRYLNISNLPYKFTTKNDECKTKEYTSEIDCDQLELNPFIKIPCVQLSKSKTGGGLLNGSYQVSVTYSIKGQTVSDFYGTTQPVSIFSHENTGKALDVEITNLDEDFPEYKLALVVTIAQQTTVYEIGTYPTSQNKVTITGVSPTDIQIPLSQLYVQKTVYSKAKDVININNQLLWSGPSSQPEINYQPLVNQASLEWVAYAVPIAEDNSDLQSYLRDEVYSFGTRLVYNNGSRSATFPFIGRPASVAEKKLVSGEDAFELLTKGCDKKTELRYWQVYNTATGYVNTVPLGLCEYKEVGSGTFGYYESTEHYPDNKNTYGNLACTPIRHFRFPDDSLAPRTIKNSEGVVTHTIHLGVRVKNLLHPKDLEGNNISSLQSIEILRGDRITDKSILGKGLLYNMGMYDYKITKDKTVGGLYPNYPYNDLNTDPFLSKTQTKGAVGKEKNYKAFGEFSKDYYTFHSPSFSFSKPSIGTELKIEGIQSGVVNTFFEPVYAHPKNKLITDVAFTVAALLGLGEAYFATREKTITTTIVESMDPIVAGTVAPVGTAYTAALEAYSVAVEAAKLAGTSDPTGCIETAAVKTARVALFSATAALATVGGAKTTVSETKQEDAISRIPNVLKCLNGIYMFGYYFQQGMETGLSTVRTFAKSEQYAYQVNSHCQYENFVASGKNSKRRAIEDAVYLYPAVQDFNNKKVNNYKRESSVILKLERLLNFPTIKDNSRKTMSSANACDTKSYSATASSYYGSIKQSQPAQYGQIQNIRWIDTGYCFPINTSSTKYTTGLILGGDTFIGKFSIKRKFNYFNQTAYNQNDDFEFDYRKYVNIPYPRYWMDSEAYDLSELVSLTPKLPDDKANLDCKKASTIFDKLKTPFVLRDQYFYLSNNGVVEFYVESEINLNNRDWKETPESRHYDSEQYSDLSTLFRSDVLDFDNTYIYDKSYSKYLTENVGFTQSIYYDPLKADSCFSSFNNRVFWSLRGDKQTVKNNKLIYLTNNSYEFPSENGAITGMKALDRSNIIFLFENSAPYLHQANDQLQTDSGIKITLGDGGLFSTPPQPILTTDLQYGKCPSVMNLVSSQFGILYPSYTQGKVFLLQGSKLDEISRYGMQWWFQNHLPFNLLKDFPEFPFQDNPIDGIGFLTSVDNTKETLYLTKIDFKVVSEYEGQIIYDGDFYLQTNGKKKKIKLKDSKYFEDVSWTISYHPGMKGWVSFHDWHPNSIIQTENHFITIKNENNKSSLWEHNTRCDKYCRYYDTQYFWDIEHCVSNGQNVTTLSNIEYGLEAYLYDKNCQTRHHLLEYNFNRAYIYNSEQVSGILNLNLAPKNQLSKMLYYPIVNTDSIDIEFHKVEQKFRFNQFWDCCKNRAEFNTSYVSTLLLENNGYKYTLNPDYIDYNKNIFQRKKLRHNWYKVYLRRQNTQDEDMPHMKIKLSNSKELISPR